MVKFNLIDAQTMGIRRAFRIQQEKYFPLPDYDLTTASQVSVIVYGKMPNIFISSSVAESIGEKGQYIKNKGFDDEKYKGWILNYLETYQKAKKRDFVELLKDSLPDTMDEQQKIYKVQNLLQALRKEGKIETDSCNHRISYWRLSK